MRQLLLSCMIDRLASDITHMFANLNVYSYSHWPI